MKPALKQRLVDRDTTILGLLDRLGRERPLDSEELRLMDNAMRRLGLRLTGKRDKWRWSQAEDAELAALNSRWARYGRPQPYQQNDAVRELAEKFGRSYMAVHRRLARLRKMRRWKRPQMFKRANGEATLISAAWTETAPMNPSPN
ncbi:MAG: hypothetical protein DMF06_05230 [Verrucomicrobia bacterium]|nr:MAG: hypothetical protein DMF06_05230 [Verrucomicrobiota bacterium]